MPSQFLYLISRPIPDRSESLSCHWRSPCCCAQLTHGSLLRRSHELGDLQSRVDAMMAKLQGYHGLPPSVLAASMKVDEARRQLQAIRAKMEANLRELEQ